jgi:hypothetical protein
MRMSLKGQNRKQRISEISFRSAPKAAIGCGPRRAILHASNFALGNRRFAFTFRMAPVRALRSRKAAEKMGGAPLEAELHRLRGEALLAGAGMVSEAEAAIEKGIDVARRQNAKSWELRAATSLARLRRQQGRQQEAVALLAPVYEWFTEGFDTADLKEARTLLDKLTEPAIAAEG